MLKSMLREIEKYQAEQNLDWQLAVVFLGRINWLAHVLAHSAEQIRGPWSNNTLS